MNDTGFEPKRTSSKKEGGQEVSSVSEVLDFFKNRKSTKSPSGSPNHSPSNSINLSQNSVTMQVLKNTSNTPTAPDSPSRKTRLEMLHSYFVSSYPTARQQIPPSSPTSTTTDNNTPKKSLTTQDQTIEKDKENEESPCSSPRQGIGNRLSRKKQQIMKWNRPEKEITKEKEKEPIEIEKEKEDEKPAAVTEKDPLRHEIQKMKLLLDSLLCRIDDDEEVVEIIQKDIERLQRRKNVTNTFMNGTKKRLEVLEEQLTLLERQVNILTGQTEISTLSVQELNDVSSKLSKAFIQLTIAHTNQVTKSPQLQPRETIQKDSNSFGLTPGRKASLKGGSHVAFELPSADEELVVVPENGLSTDAYKDMDVKQISGELLGSLDSISKLIEKQSTKKHELEEERRKLNSEISQLEKSKTELDTSINRKTLQISENESLVAKLSGNFEYSGLSTAELSELLNIVSSSQRKFSTYQ